MSNKEKIDGLLSDIRELEMQIAGMRDAEAYPVSFFSRTFDLTHKVLKDLHALETAQVETLRQQMEAHQAVLQSIPGTVIEESPQTEEESSACFPQAESGPEEEQIPEFPAAGQPEPVPSGQPARSLSDLLEKRNLSDLRKAFSLNDRFRFRRELFGGDEARMNKAIGDLNEMNSYEESVAYVSDELKWNVEERPVADFLLLIEKRFK